MAQHTKNKFLESLTEDQLKLLLIEKINFEVENNSNFDPNSKLDDKIDVSYFAHALMAEDFALAQKLLDMGADINIPHFYSAATPLKIALINNNLKILEWLLTNGADVSKNFDGYTAITIALTKGNNKAVELLIKNGANIDEVDKSNMNPLRLAIHTNNLDGFKILLENGANPYVENVEGNGAILTSLVSDNMDFVLELVKHGVNLNEPNERFSITPLSFLICENQNLEDIAKHISPYSNFNSTESYIKSNCPDSLDDLYEFIETVWENPIEHYDL